MAKGCTGEVDMVQTVVREYYHIVHYRPTYLLLGEVRVRCDDVTLQAALCKVPQFCDLLGWGTRMVQENHSAKLEGERSTIGECASLRKNRNIFPLWSMPNCSVIHNLCDP